MPGMGAMGAGVDLSGGMVNSMPDFGAGIDDDLPEF